MIQLKSQLKNNHQSPEAGYTIIEGLVAMIMVAALMVAVAPVIAFSVGTRVQARRVELASQAARSYIDAVRSGDIDPPSVTALAPSDVSTEQRAPLENALATCDSSVDSDSDPATPDDLVYCSTEIVVRQYGKFYCADGDGDGVCTSDSVADMMVLGGIVTPSGSGLSSSQEDYIADMSAANLNDDPENIEEKKELGYELLVMVYRASAFRNNNILINNQPTSSMINNAGLASRFSDGTNDIERPLFTVTSEVPPTVSSFQNLRDRLGGD